jgi:ABC-type transporter Mla subunit MlaD
MKETIEAKLKVLEDNQAKVSQQIQNGEQLLTKAKADLNAIVGAIQVCKQLLEEGKEDGGKN